MSRQSILRLTDTFFRRWWLYLLPVALLASVGFLSVKDTKDVYRSAGSINVQSTSLLDTLDGTPNDPGFGYETPAAATASNINSLIGTDQFVEQIAKNAGFDEAAISNPFLMGEIRLSVGAFPAGRTLVKIGASNEDPERAQTLALATMKTFTDSVISGEVQESQIAVDVLSARLTGYQDAVDAANQALDDYVAANGVQLSDTLPPDQQAEVARLTAAVSRAEERLFTTQTNLETAQLDLERTETSVMQRLRIVDAPPAATRPRGQAQGDGAHLRHVPLHRADPRIRRGRPRHAARSHRPFPRRRQRSLGPAGARHRSQGRVTAVEQPAWPRGHRLEWPGLARHPRSGGVLPPRWHHRRSPPARSSTAPSRRRSP